MYTIEYYKTKKEVKSLTINMEDINRIILDKGLKHLFGLYSRVKRANFGENINSITILNNNRTNLSYIYEIINCKWMVDANGDINNLDVLKLTRRLLTLLDRYDKIAEQRVKMAIKNEIELIKYYMETIINKNSSEIIDSQSIKLGNHFISYKNLK